MEGRFLQLQEPLLKLQRDSEEQLLQRQERSACELGHGEARYLRLKETRRADVRRQAAVRLGRELSSDAQNLGDKIVRPGSPTALASILRVVWEGKREFGQPLCAQKEKEPSLQDCVLLIIHMSSPQTAKEKGHLSSSFSFLNMSIHFHLMPSANFPSGLVAQP